MIEKIADANLKSEITTKILRQLPEWFGIEYYVNEYIKSVQNLPFFAYLINNEYVGFIALEAKTDINLNIHVFGVLEAYHRQGIGKKLIQESVKYAKENNYKYLTVKTVDDVVDDESYRKTRAFYYAMGFERLEVFPTLWDEVNICLMMIYQIK